MAPRAIVYGLEGPALTEREYAFFRDADPWGFILFSRNVRDYDQLVTLIAELRGCVGRRARIFVDQEGGRVQRLGPPTWRAWDDVAAMIRGLDDAAADEALRLRYRLIARELWRCGIDVNCAPVLDAPAPGAHAVIGDRALGSDAATVARRGRIVVDALLAGGVQPVIKHIPGHGRAAEDSHETLPVVGAPRADLEATDFAAFRPFADVAFAMTAHVRYDAIDPTACATFSPRVISLIRRDIGFKGLILTDDLSMGALDGPVASRCQRALAAGCDVILHCSPDMAEMEAAAEATPLFDGATLAKAEASRAPAPEPWEGDDVMAAQLEAVLAGKAHG
ncbi:MAG: glycoside hydrolase family 3 protein [Rhodobacteraceae bacterium]|nr:MAG: glycoside hydrolase family 3 protein [Paracoccaceae bacterium]